MSTEDMRPWYVAVAIALESLARCRRDDANESQQAWESKWEDFITRAAGELPHGSGFDSDAIIDTDEIKPGRIVIRGEYHNMRDGYYCGWTQFTVTVTPSLTTGFALRIVGGDGDFKDYAAECYREALRKLFPRSAFHDVPAGSTDDAVS